MYNAMVEWSFRHAHAHHDILHISSLKYWPLSSKPVSLYSERLSLSLSTFTWTIFSIKRVETTWNVTSTTLGGKQTTDNERGKENMATAAVRSYANSRLENTESFWRVISLKIIYN